MSADILQKILCFPSYVKSIEDKAVGQTMQNLNVPIVSKLKIPLIPMEVQNQYIAFVNQVDKLKFTMEKSLKELENNFNSLMQKAFKGELFS
jgi:type I restriction enzyme S subunit